MKKHSIKIEENGPLGSNRSYYFIGIVTPSKRVASDGCMHGMDKIVIAVVHNAPVPAGYDFSEASLDDITQMEAIENTLVELGYLKKVSTRTPQHPAKKHGKNGP